MYILTEQCYSNDSIRQIKLRGILKKQEPNTREITQQVNSLHNTGKAYGYYAV